MLERPNHEGLLLCRLQGEVFESSTSYFEGSSDIFVRRFSHSALARRFDSEDVLNDNACALKCLSLLKGECGEISFGQRKYAKVQMYWMGYMYRFFCLSYGLSSSQAYRILKPGELANAYLGCHTLDCAQALSRMLGERGISFEEEDLEERAKRIYARLLREGKKQGMGKRKAAAR